MDSDPQRLYSPRLLALFERYLARYIGRHFNALRIAVGGMPPPLDRPTVLYANHPSWWDPIVLLLAARRLYPDRRLYAPIDAGALRRYPILRRCGLFPIEPGTPRGAKTFMRVARSVMREPGAVLGLTAQGEFRDVRRRPLGLKSGIAKLLAEEPGWQAVPVAVEYTFWNERLPEALLAFGQTPLSGGAASDALNAAFETALARELDRLAELGTMRDPAHFQTLLDGHRRGVGGVHDWYLSLRHRLGGRRFDSAHAAIRRD